MALNLKKPNIKAPDFKSKSRVGSGADKPRGTANKLPIDAVMKRIPGGGGSAGRFIYFVGDDGAILVFMQGGKVVRRLFAPTPQPDHVKSLVELMASHPKAPVYMLVDMIDQSYVRHTLPPVSKLSVNKLVQRRLERDFSPEDIKGHLTLGRDKTGRKEWSLLLISLASSASLKSWLDVVTELPNEFKGVYLVPVESQALIAELEDRMPKGENYRKPQWVILVSHNKVGGFRQVVLKDGKLVFTRLAQAVGESVPAVIAGNIEQEVQSTIEYLRRLGYNEQAGLGVYVVVAQEIKDSIEVAKLQAQQCYLMTPFEIAQYLALEQAVLSADRFGDVVLAATFGRSSRHQLKLMPNHVKRIEQIYKARMGGRALAGLCAVWILWTLITSIWTIISGQIALHNLQGKKQKAQAELQDVQSKVSKMDKDVNLKMNVIQVYDLFKPFEYTPFSVIKGLAGLLNDESVIKRIAWQYDPAIAKPQAPQPAQPGAAPAPEAPTPIKVELEIQFVNYNADKQLLLNHAGMLVARMKSAFVDYEVKYDKLPGEVADNESITLDFNASDPTKTAVAIGQDDVMKVALIGPFEGMAAAQTQAGGPVAPVPAAGAPAP